MGHSESRLCLAASDKRAYGTTFEQKERPITVFAIKIQILCAHSQLYKIGIKPRNSENVNAEKCLVFQNKFAQSLSGPMINRALSRSYIYTDAFACILLRQIKRC